MSKIAPILILISLPFFTIAQKYKGDSWSDVKANGSGTLSCVYYSIPGLVYKDTDGQMKGVCVDIVKDFAEFVKTKYGKTLNIKYVGEEPVFTDFLNNVASSSNALGVANVTITEERKKKMKFTPPFMSNPMVMLTHKTAPSLSSLDEISTKLNGFTAQVITASTHQKYMQEIKKEYYPELEIMENPSGQVVLSKILNNETFFTILDFTEYFDAVRQKMPVKRQNLVVGDAEELGFIMPKNSDWAPLWEEFLTPEYINSIKYKKIISDNLGNAYLGLMK